MCYRRKLKVVDNYYYFFRCNLSPSYVVVSYENTKREVRASMEQVIAGVTETKGEVRAIMG